MPRSRSQTTSPRSAPSRVVSSSCWLSCRRGHRLLAEMVGHIENIWRTSGDLGHIFGLNRCEVRSTITLPTKPCDAVVVESMLEPYPLTGACRAGRVNGDRRASSALALGAVRGVIVHRPVARATDVAFERAGQQWLGVSPDNASVGGDLVRVVERRHR